MIALDKELIEKIKEEATYIGLLFITVLIILKIVFYKENMLILLRTTLALFWMFVLPGFCLMYYWYEKVRFLERFLIGSVLGGAIIGICSYYLGLLGLNIKYSGVILPIVMISIAAIILWKKKSLRTER